jgi:hypothetical protein
MSTDEVIAEVLAILGPSTPSDEQKLAKLKQIIRWGLDAVENNRRMAKASGRYGVVTHKQKQAAKAAASALLRLQHVMRKPDLVRRDWKAADDAASHADETVAAEHFDLTVERLHALYQRDADRPLSDSRYRAMDSSKRAAAETAAKVLSLCGLPPTLHRDGSYVKIATAIYGEQRVNLYEVCRAVAHEAAETTLN